MHVLHLIAVQSEEPLSDPAAEGALYEALGDNEWFDYLSVGGRWAGFFNQVHGLSLPTGNVLPVAEHPDTVFAALEQVARQQNEAFCGARDHVTGAPVVAADLSGHVFGLPVEETEEAAARATTMNAETAKSWSGMLGAQSLADARAVPGIGMAGYYASKMIRLLDGVWFADSYYLDTVAHSADPIWLMDGLRGRADVAGVYPEGLAGVYLLAVDLHF